MPRSQSSVSGRNRVFQDGRPAARESPLRDWGEDGSQAQDDSRSWCSYRSEGECLSSGAVSESGRDHQNHVGSVRSTGSVCSQESQGRHRSTNHASHVMNGETRFPTVMSYVSDAQRSDAATVCSSSIIEDIELESVHSQEDHAHSTASYSQPRRRSESDGKLAILELKSRTAPSKDLTEYSHVNQVELAMGPPLSRVLLLQKETASHSFASSAFNNPNEATNQAHSEDGGSSVDFEAQSTTSQDDVPLKQSAEEIDKKKSDNQWLLMNGVSAAASAGSHAGSDCGGSLDVETHSQSDARSIHSQDFCSTSEPTDTARADGAEVARTSQTSSPVASSSLENGRRSPGGTIYKGRGVRRYQGRYMHLPLKRFHQEGVHLDWVDELSATKQWPTAGFQQASGELDRSERLHMGNANGRQFDDRQKPKKHRNVQYRQGDRDGVRSRSRSRSPEGRDSSRVDLKPRAFDSR